MTSNEPKGPAQRGAWIFGTPLERLADGIPLLGLNDTVFPWTKPAGTLEAPLPEWWPTDPPPDPQYDRGALEGWHRNFRESSTGAPNFPVDRGFNVASLTLGGLRQAATAPFRWGANSQRPEDPNAWHVNMEFGVTNFLKWYIDHYLNENTNLIVWLPERELMSFLGVWGPAGSDEPDPAAAYIALTEIIWFLMSPENGVADRVLGWGLIDEPEGGWREPHTWASPYFMALLRNFVRDTEQAARAAYDPDGYGALPEEVQRDLLKPVLITLTDRFITDLALAWGPAEFKGAGAADVFMIDFYPYRRFYDDVKNDFSECTGVPNYVRPLSLTDPARSIEAVRLLRLDLNPPGVRLGDPGYIPVVNWNQCDGSPFREADPPVPDSSMTPSPPPVVPAPCGLTPDGLGRYKKLPSPVQGRYLAWGSLLEMSEGSPWFGQTGCPDDVLFGEFRPLALELQFFRRLRARLVDRSAQFTFSPGGVPEKPDGEKRVYLAPVRFLVDYPLKNQPKMDLDTEEPTIFDEGSRLTWLGIINHSGKTEDYDLTFLANLPDIRVGSHFEEVKYFQPAATPHIVLDSGLHEKFRVEAFSFKLWRLRSDL